MKTLFWLFFLGCLVFGLSSCQNNPSPQITEEKMEKFINENIPLGTPRSDVLAYLKTLKFGSHSLIGVDYYYGRDKANWPQNSQPPNVHSYVRASLPDAYTQRDGIFLDTYFMMMAFYFDENEKLIGHGVISMADSS
jgi:hypothetical protein